MVMEQGAPWGNRVVGKTDELHFARAIDPDTLRESDSGVIMTPHHIHAALREYLGLSQFAVDAGFGSAGGEVMPLFDPFFNT